METNIMTEGKKNIIMSINTEKFAKDLQKEEKTLKSLQRTNANEAVIDAQKQVIKDLQEKYDDSVAAEELAKEYIGDSPITFQVVNEGTGKTEEVKKKIAFVKNNRPINNVKVDKFISIIAKDKYEKAYPIIVTEAKQLIESGYKVYDLKGREISLEEADGYFEVSVYRCPCTVTHRVADKRNGGYGSYFFVPC